MLDYQRVNITWTWHGTTTFATALGGFPPELRTMGMPLWQQNLRFMHLAYSELSRNPSQRLMCRNGIHAVYLVYVVHFKVPMIWFLSRRFYWGQMKHHETISCSTSLWPCCTKADLVQVWFSLTQVPRGSWNPAVRISADQGNQELHLAISVIWTSLQWKSHGTGKSNGKSVIFMYCIYIYICIYKICSHSSEGVVSHTQLPIPHLHSMMFNHWQQQMKHPSNHLSLAPSLQPSKVYPVCWAVPQCGHPFRACQSQSEDSFMSAIYGICNRMYIYIYMQMYAIWLYLVYTMCLYW